jgi:hypothetical protein
MVSSLEITIAFSADNGDGHVHRRSDAALSEDDRDLNPSEGAAWGDYNKDGYLDLYLANYEMPGASWPSVRATSSTQQRRRHLHRRGRRLGIDPLLPAGVTCAGAA